MPVECPNCRRPIPRARLFFTTMWGRWRCKGCGSLLGIDVRRRLLAMIPWILILVVLVGFLRITNLGYMIAIPTLLGAAIVNFFLLDRAVVHERAGYRCRSCGYDLLGQVEPRCPECGAGFDLTDLEAFKAGGPREEPSVSWTRSALAITIILSLAVLLAIGGLLQLRALSVRATAGSAVTTQPTTQANLTPPEE
jgi:hypothetical protein